MKKLFPILYVLFLFNQLAIGQDLSQTVRGQVLDSDTQQPLIGATVLLLNSQAAIGATTDLDGHFRLENMPVGRVNLQIDYLGYENKTLSNIEVNSGKEVVLTIALQEAIIKMEEVVVKANKRQGTALNDLALVSARSISAEKTERFAGGFSDPSRIVSAFAGVATTNDGDNDIIVRGNSPKYIQWRLEGVDITNPTHFGDQNGVRGGVSALNNNLLSTSDFYTGAFAPEYGDALSGIYDLKLRAGNNEKREATFGFGLLGTDFTLEGPLKKGYGGSYLVNYRYSTISLVSDLGLVNIDGLFNFQDAAFKIVLPTKKSGVFSFFGLGGFSSFSLEDVKRDLFVTPGDLQSSNSVKEEYEKSNYLFNVGLNHTYSITTNSYIKTTLAYSGTGIDDDVYEYETQSLLDEATDERRDSILNRNLDDQSRLSNTTLRGAITYNNKLNAKNKLQVGAKYNLVDYDYEQSWLEEEFGTRFAAVDFKEQIGSLQTFISWKHRFNEAVSMVAGLHNMNVLYNNKSTLEPRVAVNWKVSPSSIISFGFGQHSKMESIHNYFAKVVQADGQTIEPNKDLDLLKARHYVLGFEKRFSNKLVAKIEGYYQDLYNLPVENIDTSYYATINESNEFRYVDLVNKGTGKNYGIELTLERFFDNSYYFLLNGSIFTSTYKALDGQERNTQYNGKYLVNLLVGKEFDQLGRKKNRTLSLNAKVFFGGGKRILPLLRDSDGNIAVDLATNQYWDYDKAYEAQLDDLYTVILSASYKINKPKTTHEIFINLDNITNTKGRISEFYDPTEPESTGYVAQFGFFPNLMYRVYF